LVTSLLVITKPPTLFGGNGTLVPKLRELCLSAVYRGLDVGAVSFQNLRKLEIRNQLSDVGPTFGQFVALIAASPKLETLDISGYCPDPSLYPRLRPRSCVSRH
jgi:hypothetical protein